MQYRTATPSRGPTLTAQRNALARPAAQGRQVRVQGHETGPDAWRRLAEEAMQAGLSKAEWLNQMYGTNFFSDSTRNKRESWGKDWRG
jgi:hypothetical protein